MATEGYSRRGESEAARLDRNYSELLQELRVVQNGVQILFAFLLGIAFQTRFAGIKTYQRDIYIVTLVAAACAAITLIAPAAIHRMLFRRHQKHELVILSSRLAASGLIFLAIAILSSVLLVIDIAANFVVAVVVTALLAVLIVALWFALPREVRRRYPTREIGPMHLGEPFEPPG